MRADLAGLDDLSGALRKWADLLPRLNEEFHEDVREDIRAMDAVAQGLMNRLDRLYGDNLDKTSDEVQALMYQAVQSIDKIGAIAVSRYRELLWETECTVEAIAQKIASPIEELIPRFRWIRENIFGHKLNTLKTTGLDGREITHEYLPGSDTAKLRAEYEILQLRLASASETTPMKDIMSIAGDLQTKAFEAHCFTRAAAGKPKSGEFYTLWVEARESYDDLAYLYLGKLGQ